MKWVTIIVWILLTMPCANAAGQTDSTDVASLDSSYTVELSASVYPVISFFEHERYPGASEEAMFGYGATVRVMWHPDRLLAVGVLTGYSLLASELIPPLNSEGQQQYASVSLSAVPLQAIVSMQGAHLEVAVGMGPNILFGQIDDGNATIGVRWELALTAIGSYRWYLKHDLAVVPELRITYLSYRGILSVIPALTIRYDLFAY